MTHLGTAVTLALATGALSVITSQSKISVPPRMWLAKRESKAGTWLYELVSCPLCTATWLSLAAAAVYRPLLVSLFWPLDYLVTALAMVPVAMLAVLVIRRAVH